MRVRPWNRNVSRWLQVGKGCGVDPLQPVPWDAFLFCALDCYNSARHAQQTARQDTSSQLNGKALIWGFVEPGIHKR